MKKIFKLNYLKESNIEKIIVFFGRSYTDDSIEPLNTSNIKAQLKTDITSLTELFRDDINNPYFKDIFSETEKKNIIDNNIDVIFSELEINIDDSIDIIKRKIIFQFKKEISFNDIYLFGLKSQTLSISRIYKELTQDGRLELTQSNLFQYLLNIMDIDLSDIEKRDIYSYEDLISLGLDNKKYLMKIPIGQIFK